MGKLFIILFLPLLLWGCSLGKVDGYSAEEWRDKYDWLLTDRNRMETDYQDQIGSLEDELYNVQSEFDDLSSCVEDHPLSASDNCI